MTRTHGRYVCGAALAGAVTAIALGGAAQAATSLTCPAGQTQVGNSCFTTVVKGETFTQAPADPGDPGDPAVAATTAVNGLPFTGSDVVPLVLTGGALLVGGATCLVVARRRRAV